MVIGYDFMKNINDLPGAKSCEFQGNLYENEMKIKCNKVNRSEHYI